MVRATIRNENVTYHKGKWEGASPSLLEKIEAAMSPAIETVSGADPSPEKTVAEYVVAELGGQVTFYDNPDDSVPGRIY